VPLNTTIRAEIDGRDTGDVDVYRVPVVPGGRLTVEVDSVRISDFTHGHGEDSGYDLKLRVVDAAGRQLAANDDNPLHVQDPLASIRLPESLPPLADGTPGTFAFVEVRRSTFSGHTWPYVVHVGDWRRPLAAYPPGGPAGQPVAIEFLGDPLGSFTETVVTPAEPGTFGHVADWPTPFRLRTSAMPNVLEDAAGDTAVTALPAALNGVIAEPGDVDRFRVTVKKGDRYRVRVFAGAIGSPLQPRLEIMSPSADGQTATPPIVKYSADREDRDTFGISAYNGSVLPEAIDPSVIWEPKVDGEHVIAMTDLGAGWPPARAAVDALLVGGAQVGELRHPAGRPVDREHQPHALPGQHLQGRDGDRGGRTPAGSDAAAQPGAGRRREVADPIRVGARRTARGRGVFAGGEAARSGGQARKRHAAKPPLQQQAGRRRVEDRAARPLYARRRRHTPLLDRDRSAAGSDRPRR
jgi:hypothetical protein